MAKTVGYNNEQRKTNRNCYVLPSVATKALYARALLITITSI
ncbi:hypothetical protein CPS_2545 [Colwellia psychrerythraea 34H]|uniref:Uncharacterized protein n=1 Tax=Colwellia psychrerythraea (strain 34H / ATCC BAA-681) TaxID=167879 RepID=Q481K9_COLP3|nr:hypothetical protein CPS_2545 [Colwellia psychrerythraea 34H]